jgi:hypothetical protein
MNEVVYLYMDNAGGHGTEEAIKEYTKILHDVFRIEKMHQVPRSPETNTLDLGIWCCLQWAVDALMKGRQGDIEALHQGVMEMWNKTDLEGAFSNVWKHLARVLRLIHMDNGGNEQVESKRGRKWTKLDEPVLDDDLQGMTPAVLPTKTEPDTIDLVEEDDEDEFEDDDEGGACFLV